MRKLLWMLLVSACLAQSTPNLNFNIPSVGTPAWGPLVNANFSLLDSLLSGAGVLPGLKSKIINGVPYADQFSGSDACAKINAALSALPVTGGVVNALGFQGAQPCSSNPFSGITKSGAVLLGSATFQTTASWVIPTKVHVYGVGRGDSGSNNTSIQAVAGFPSSTPVIAFGVSAPSFGIRIENLQVDCNNLTGSIGVQNLNSQEESGVRHILILNCPNKGLDIEGASQNSGPYEDVEILNQSGGTAATIPVVVNQVTAFRGLHGATINANGATSPTVAIQFDSDGTVSDIHCEHIGDCIRIGSVAATSDAIVTNMECGPAITTCVHISNAFSNQDISILGIVSTAGNSIVDDIFSTTLSASSEGFYFIGNGTGANKTRLSSDNTVAAQFSNSASLKASLSFVEGAASGAAAGNDSCQGDSTAHALKCSYNNGSFLVIPQAITTSFTTTAATTDNVTVTGMTATGHCHLTPTNSAAAGGIASVFISAKTTNQITVTHTATSGWTFDVMCSPQ